MLTAVPLPKTVAIENARLAVFHRLLQVTCIGVFTVYKFWAQRGATIEIGVHTRLTVEVVESSHESMAEVSIAANFSDIGCTESVIGRNRIPPGKGWVDYSQGPWKTVPWPYGNYTPYGVDWKVAMVCMDLCTWADLVNMTSTAKCMHDVMDYSIAANRAFTAEHFLITHSSTAVSLATSLQHFRFKYTTNERQLHIGIAPYIARAKLRFVYDIRRIQQTPWFFGTDQERSQPLLWNSASTTVVLDSQGSPFKSFLPGEKIEMYFEEIWFATIGDHLNITVLTNGAELEAIADCFGTAGDVDRAIASHATNAKVTSWSFDARFDSPVCLVYFRETAKKHMIRKGFHQWQGRLETMIKFNGIRLDTGSGNGFLRFYDLSNIILQMISILVLARLPVHITKFVAKHMLGQISKIYGEAIDERFVLENILVSATIELISNSSDFKELSDSSGDRISKAKFFSSFETSLSGNPCLDVEEARRVAEYSFTLLTGFHRNPVVDGGKPMSLRNPDTSVTLDAFQRARMKSEKIDFDAVVKLFDTDRHVGLLEQYFAPGSLRRIVQHSSAHKWRQASEGGQESTEGVESSASMHALQGLSSVGDEELGGSAKIETMSTNENFAGGHHVRNESDSLKLRLKDSANENPALQARVDRAEERINSLEERVLTLLAKQVETSVSTRDRDMNTSMATMRAFEDTECIARISEQSNALEEDARRRDLTDEMMEVLQTVTSRSLRGLAKFIRHVEERLLMVETSLEKVHQQVQVKHSCEAGEVDCVMPEPFCIHGTLQNKQEIHGHGRRAATDNLFATVAKKEKRLPPECLGKEINGDRVQGANDLELREFVMEMLAATVEDWEQRLKKLEAHASTAKQREHDAFTDGVGYGRNWAEHHYATHEARASRDEIP